MITLTIVAAILLGLVLGWTSAGPVRRWWASVRVELELVGVPFNPVNFPHRRSALRRLLRVVRGGGAR